MLLHFPTLRIWQIALFGCKSRGFVIYNEFSALVSSALACPFLQLVSCPEGLHSIPPLCRPKSLSPFFLLRLPPLHPSSPRTAETSQVCSSCASSGSCLPWYIMREPQGHHPTRSQGSCNLSNLSHMALDIIDPLNQSTARRGLK